MEQVKRYWVFEWHMTGDLEERDPQQFIGMIRSGLQNC